MLMRFPVFSIVLSLAVGLLSAACLDVPNDSDHQDQDAGEGCLACHHTGDDYGTCTDCHGAHGDSQAHEKHLWAELWGQPVACEDCHQVPLSLFEGDHFNSTVDVVFAEGSLARTGDLEPEWDGMRCTNVYCHGAGLTGGSYTEPAWQGEKDEGILCGDCHGIPPLAPHTDETGCSSCHATAYTDAGTLDFDIHLNGVVEF